MKNLYETYALAATSLQNHLKHLWERAESRVEYLNFLLLRNGISTYSETDKVGDSLQKELINRTKQLLTGERALDDEAIFVDNYFADLLEEYFSLLRTANEQNDDRIPPSEALEGMYVFIANLRALLKKVRAFSAMLEAPIQLPTGTRIKDDRIELTLHSIQELTGATAKDRRHGIKKLRLLRFLGRPCYYAGVISLVILIGLVIAEVVGRFIQTQDLQYLRQESAEAYNEALKALPSPALGTPLGMILYTVTIQTTWIFFLCAFLYMIVGKRVFKALLERPDKSPDLKYLLAWGYIDAGIFPFNPSLEHHKLMMLEAADEGCDDAYIRLGVMYEKGLFGSKKEPMSEADKLDNALRCYKNAFPNANAIKKYNAAKAKRENVL